jgi:pterin-4a-carbinolamine dehydratase
MKPGIKIGPENWEKVLKKTKPQCAEVWFRLEWKDKYKDLIKTLNQKNIPFGLHFWTTIKTKKGKLIPNLLGDKKTAEKTCRKIIKTIDIAKQYKAAYVNFHPESYKDNLLDLDKKTFKTLNKDKKITENQKQKQFNQLLHFLKKIKRYADKKQIIPYIETVPKYVPQNYKDPEKGRLNPQPSQGLETEKFKILNKLNYPICLDLGHTMGQKITENKQKLFNYLYKTAKQIRKNTGLIHITANIPPFNGTDSHNGFTKKDKQKGAVPTKKQLEKILKLHKNKNTWLIPEPKIEDMIINYKIIRTIVNKIEKNNKN